LGDSYKSFDVVVVGGGPSGLALSLILRQHSSLSVVVVEKTTCATQRVGETLSPGIHTLLQHLGVWDSFKSSGHLTSFGTAASWGVANLVTRDFISTPHGNGWHLDRQRFDETLVRHSEEAGVLILRDAVARCYPQAKGGWNVEVKSSKGFWRIVASFLVDATGITATVARCVGARRQVMDRMVGVSATIQLPEQAPRDTFTLVEAFESGWWYSARLSSSRAIIVLMTDSDLVRAHGWAEREGFWAVLRNSPHSWNRLKTGRATGPPRVNPAFSAYLNPVYGRDWIAVGDAAASYDPLSSSGIARALDSGIRGARALHRYLLHQVDEFAAHNQYIQKSYAEYLKQRHRYYAMECRWPSSRFWTRRHQMQVAEDRHQWRAD
jgi:flavin-dependent dehydrogenase